MIYLIIFWIALGIHSAYYLVKQYTKKYDFTKDEIPMLFICVIFPIFSHVATYIVYHKSDKPKVIFPMKLNRKK